MKKNDDKIFEVTSRAHDFWFKNCLYLEKSTRDNFYRVVSLVANYSTAMEIWRSEEPGPEKQERSKEIKQDWEDIFELPKIIMKDVALEPFNLTDQKDAFGN